MKKILLINRGGSDNIGDQAIKISLENLLKNMGFQTDFYDFANIYRRKHYSSNSKENSAPLFKKGIISALVPDKVKWLIRNHKIYQACFNDEDYEAVIIGGGQLFNNNKVFALAMFLWVHLIKYKKKSKIYLFGIGAMRNLSFTDKLLYKNVLRNVDGVYVRDEYSREVLLDLFGFKSNLTYDVAFCFNKYEPYVLKRPKKNNEKLNRVLIGVSHFLRYQKYNDDNSSEEYYNYWVEKIFKLYSKDNTSIKLFYTTEEDLMVSTMIQKIIEDKYDTYIPIADVSNIDKLINEIIKADTVISPRMHALILSKIYQCNVEPVYISDKIKSFSKHYLEDDFSLEETQNKVINDLKEILKSTA